MDSVEGMQSSVKYDESNQQIIVAYPFTPEAYVQPDNFKQVQSIQQTIEKRVYSQGLDEEYNAEMSCMIEAGCVSKMTEEERKDQSYGVHYMPHFAVLDPESKSTKLRIVLDSACRTKHSRLLFNDLVRPVPNVLNDITDVQLCWRSFPTALNFDLTKAYHSLRTGPREFHLRRFLYRFKVTDPWEVYKYRIVAFGDTPATLTLCQGLELTAEKGRHIDLQAADQLTRNSLADDIGVGGMASEVMRMRGEKCGTDYTGSVPRVLACGGFRAKALVPSYSTDPEEVESMGDRFLGLACSLLGWLP